MLFNPNTDIAKRILEIFSNNIDLLKKAYLIVDSAHKYNDYDGFIFNMLLDCDSNFLYEYVAYQFSRTDNSFIYEFEDTRNYEFLWKRPDHTTIVSCLIENICEHEEPFFQHSYLNTFFMTSSYGNRQASEESKTKQDKLLLDIIRSKHQEFFIIKCVFSLIVEFEPIRRLKFIDCLLKTDPNFETFDSLDFEPSHWSSNGTWVPVIEGRIKFWISVSNLLNSLNYLPHKQKVEKTINHLRHELEHEKRNDFIRDF